MTTLATLKSYFTQSLANQAAGALVADWAHWTQLEIFKTPHKYWWNKRKTTFSTVISTPEYFLTSDIWGRDILFMGDENVQGKEIVEKPLEWIYRYDSTPTDEGEPFCWALVNMQHVTASNTATTASAVSSDNADQSITVTIHGKVGGVELVEQIALSGTSPAAAGSPLTWDADSVYSVALENLSTGYVTVTIGNVVAVIPPGELRVECPRIRLHYVPGEALVIPYIYYRRPRRLVKNQDIVDMPDFALPCLMKGIESWGHSFNGDIDFARSAKEEFEGMKADLISFSKEKLQACDKKYWETGVGEPKFFLPRTIDATVT